MAKYKNRTQLIGRVSGKPMTKRLPSGDEIVELRLVVERDDREGVDTLDIAIWPSRPRKRPLSLKDQEWISVSGVLRRRFWRNGTDLASRWQVEARELTKV
jgi:single-strand DNA-binding protein